MARQQTKLCPGCSTLFRAKATAIACSPRCRKRLERARKSIGLEAKSLAQTTESAIKSAEVSAAAAISKLESTVLSELSPSQATEAGFVVTPTVTLAPHVPPATPPPQPTFNPANQASYSEPAPANPAILQPEENLEIAPVAAQQTPAPKSVNSVPAANLNTPDLSLSGPARTPAIPEPGQDILLDYRFSAGQKPLKPFSPRQALHGFNLFYPAAAVVITLLGLGSLLYMFSLRNNGSSNLQNQRNASASIQQVQASNPFSSATQNGVIRINRDTIIDKGSNFSATGKVALQNQVNSNQAFNVQNATGDVLFNIDTTGKAISFGGPNNNIALSIAGAVTISGALNVNTLTAGSATIGSTGVTLGTLTVCSTEGCVPNTRDAVTLQGENASFFTNASNLTAGTISDNRLSTNVALLNAAQTFINTNTFRPTTNSTSAFQIQNAAGTTVFSVDTVNGNVGIGASASTGAGKKLLVASNSTSGTQLVLQNSDTGGQAWTVVSTGSGNSGGAGQLQFINGSGTRNIVIATNGNVGIGADVLNPSATLHVAGNALFKNTSNTTTAFQVQDSGGINLLVADTTNHTVIVKGKSPQTTDIFQVQDSTGNNIFRVDGTSAYFNTGAANGKLYFDNNSHGAYIWSPNNDGSLRLVASSTSIQASANSFVFSGQNGGAVFQLANSANNSASSGYLMSFTGGDVSGVNTYGLRIQNNTSITTFNVTPHGSTTITNYAPTDISLSLQGAVSQSADLVQLKNSSGNTLTKFNSNGDLQIGGTSSAASTTAFQIQNSSGTSIFTADTTNMNITLDGANTGQVGAWTINTNVLPAALTQHTSVTANGYMYVLGGGSGGVDSTTVYYTKLNADGSTGSWQTSNNALPQALDGAVSVAANGYVYYIGGENSGGTTQSTVYYAKLNPDGSTGSWQTSNNALPQSLWAAESVAANGYVYIMGGRHTGGSVVSTVYYAKLNPDGSTGSWQTNSNSLPSTIRNGVAVSANGYVYYLGGSDDSGNTVNTVYYAQLNTNGSTGAFSTNTNNLPQALRGSTAVVANGYVYYIGGKTSASGTNASQSTVYYGKLNSNGSINSFSTNTNTLPAIRSFGTSVIANGYIYYLGGDASGIAQSTVYYASTSRTQIAGSLDLVGISGQTLSDEGTGGSLTAGNTQIVGQLNVTNQANFTRNVSIGGNLSVTNSAGTTLAADNSNLQAKVTNLAASGTISLQGPDGGSILLRTAANSGTGTAMTFSGNEITDKTRSTNTQGDGKQPPDSSTGIWESTTNLVTNGGFESTNNWTANNGATLTRDTGISKFGAASLKVTTPGSQNTEGARNNESNRTFSVGETYTASAWVKAPAGATLQLRVDEAGAFNLNFLNFTATGSWQRVQVTGTVSSGQGGSFPAGIQVVTNGTQAITYWLDGMQFEQKSIATPYVETNGGTASRSAGRIQAPSSVINTNQSWMAFRVRPGFSSSFAGNAGADALFGWSTDTSTRMQLIYTGSGTWSVARLNSGTGNGASATATWSAGDILTVVVYWTSTQIAISINGSSFTTNTNGTSVSIAASTFDIGSRDQIIANGEFNGEVLWASAGTGTLSNTDAATLYNYGNSDPTLSSINSIDSSASPTFAWDGESTQYSGTNSTPTLQSGITIDDVNLTHSANGSLTLQGAVNSTTAFQIQNSAGQNLFQADTTGMNLTFDGANTGQTGAWTTNTNALPGPVWAPTSVAANGYVYVLGGANGSPVSTVYYAKLNADGSVASWTTSSQPLPQTIAFATSVVANGYVYVIGGQNGSSTVSTVYYAKLNADGSTGAWQTNSNALPQALYTHTSVVANGYVYVLGGDQGGAAVVSTVYYAKLNANGSTGTWSTNSNALPVARENATSVVANGYVYVIGGQNASTVYYAKLNADGSTGTWTTNTNALPDVRANSSSVVANGYVYVMGGANGIGTIQSTVYYAKLNADGSTGTWTTSANSLPAIRYEASSIIANGYIYFMAGYNGSAAQSTVYYASTSRVQIGANLDLVGLQGGNISDADGLSQGSVGGSITAGNITAVGALQVQGQGNFSQNLSVNGNLNIGGSALFQNAADSTTAFQIQTAGSTNLLAIDTSGNGISIGVTGSVNANSTVHIADSSSGVQTITIGSTNSSSAVTIQAGTGRIVLKGQIKVAQSGTALSGSNLAESGAGTPTLGTGSTDTAGSITTSTTSHTTVTLTFGATMTNAPFCTISAGNAAAATILGSATSAYVTTTATTMVINTAADTTAAAWTYHCFTY